MAVSAASALHAHAPCGCGGDSYVRGRPYSAREAFDERNRSPIQRVAAIVRPRLRFRYRGGGARGVRPRPLPDQSAGFRGQARPRRGAHHRRLPARLAARHFRIVVERALPGLRRRARCGRDAQDHQSRRIRLRAVRRRLQADARRNGRGDFHGEPARAPHRRAQSRHARPKSNITGRFSGARASICRRRWKTASPNSPSIRSSWRPARRRCCRCSCRKISSSCSIR